MCGIAGIVRFAGLRPEECGLGAAMAAQLRHRGPDDAGTFTDHCASLGHVRLSIIDVRGGHQPMSNEDGTIQVVCNGEIYNHRVLAGQLRSTGHRLRTRCDTEVIGHLYEDYGESFVEHLNGMFAIAVWDSRRRRLLLARDRLGIKPLYWHDDGRRIAFGSELKAVLAAGDLARRVDPCALSDYLALGHVPAPRTILQGIRKLEPGFLAVCSRSGVSLRRWWDIPFRDEEPTVKRSAGGAEPQPAEARERIEAFADLLEDAVGMRLMSEVPLGAFLSGGVDSSAVVAAMRRQAAGAVFTQTVGFDETDCDERDVARSVAQKLGTDHREVMVRPDAAWAARRLAGHFDEPFADACAVPMFYLSEAMSQRVTVALSGDGGDEMLAGYRRYRFDLAESALRARCPRWLRRSTAGVAGWLYPKADWLPRPLRAKVTLQNLACDDATAHLRSVSIRAGTLPGILLRPEVQAELSGYDPFERPRELFARCPSSQLLNRLLYVDMKTLMADDILTKVDRASMAVGLEVRVPLLDHRLVELAARMPVSLKLAGTSGKYVLRQALTHWMSKEAAARPKQGFDVPLDAWFRGPLREMAQDLLTSSGAVCRQWINPAEIEHVLTGHQRRLSANGQLLWTLLSLELWAQVYSPSAPAPQPTSRRWGTPIREGVAR